MAWAALALIQAQEMLKPNDNMYGAAAKLLADWIILNTSTDDGLGGFMAGLKGFELTERNPSGQKKRENRITVHNFAVAALFDHLATAAGPPRMRASAG